MRLLSTGWCGETENDAGDPGRGEQAYAVLAHRFEGHQRKAQGDEHDDGVEDARQHPHLGDVFACQKVVVDINAEVPQIEVGGEMQRGHRHPAEQANGAQHQDPRDHALGIGSERRCGQRDGKRNEQQTEARWIPGSIENRSQIGPASAQQPAQDRKNCGVQQPRRRGCPHQEHQGHGPGRRERERIAYGTQCRLGALDDVLPHAANYILKRTKKRASCLLASVRLCSGQHRREVASSAG